MTSKITYLGDLRTELTHISSGQTIITDAPIDNQGKGLAFSPTDLAATSLGACMITIMGISARNHGLNIDGTELEITKIMASNPRRIQEIEIKVIMPHGNFLKKDRVLLEAAGRTCPVAFSLHPDINQNITFIWK
ncbi:MAG: OsmC family protein [Saprospiraceae bacterium]|nr:OsmC family protein [Saprospiraceae bacterium]MCB9310713.1 OsmC family protein [Lewinellaceae bacterium]